MTVQPAAPIVPLDGALGVRTAEPLRRTLLQAIAEHPAIAIDCAAAASIDLSTIQLLLAARRSAADAGKRVTLSTPVAPMLLAALRQGGFLPPPGQATPTADPFWLGAA